MKVTKSFNFLLALCVLFVSSNTLAGVCTDFANTVSYGVVGDNKFKFDKTATINGNPITGTGNTPTPSGSSQTINSTFIPLNPEIFPALGGPDIKVKNQPLNVSAGSYGDIEFEPGNANDTVIFSGGSYYIEELKIKKDAILELAAGDYFIDKLTLEEGVNLVLSGGGPVRFFISDKFDAKKEVKINANGVVSDLQIFLYDNAEFEMDKTDKGSSANDFTGIIYSPHANTKVKIGDDVGFEGAILTAGEVDLKKNVELTFTPATEAAVWNVLGCTDPSNPPAVVAVNFNCVHSAAGDTSNGRLYTRVVGSPFNFDVTALDSSGAVETAYADLADRNVTVELVDMSGGGACGSLPALSPTVSQVITFTASDAGRKASANMTVNKAYRSVGCRVTDANDTPSVVGCSSDSFAIRPASLSLSPPALNNAGATGAPVAIAGDPAGFTLEVTTVAGYDGTPVIAGGLEAHSGGVAGSLTGTFPAADINTGTTSGTSFIYDEVGNFRFPVEAIRDTSFTSVDQTTDCVDNSYSNTVNGNGKVGCDFANTAVTDWVGRFRPDHFALSVVNGTLDNTCIAGGFSYAGTAIPFLVDAALTITAENALTPPTTTQNYTGSYAKLYLAGLSMTESETAQNVSLTWNVDFDSPTVQTDTGNSNKLIFTAGQSTLSLTGDTFTLGRAASEILAPFAPAIEISVNSVQEDAVLGDGVVAQDENGAANGKIQIQPSAGALTSRYGRLNILSASGTEQQDLNVPVHVEYFDGSNFITNTDDSCTSQVEIALSAHSGEIQPADTCFSPACSAAASYILSPAGNGDFSDALQAPNGGKTGVLKVDALNVPTHLLYDWLGTGVQNPPSATASFGNYHWENQMIYMREVR